jgi:hypothetical protein
MATMAGPPTSPHGWWQANDGRWYPPQTHPDPAVRSRFTIPAPPPQSEVSPSIAAGAARSRRGPVLTVACLVVILLAGVGAVADGDDAELATTAPLFSAAVTTSSAAATSTPGVATTATRAATPAPPSATAPSTTTTFAPTTTTFAPTTTAASPTTAAPTTTVAPTTGDAVPPTTAAPPPPPTTTQQLVPETTPPPACHPSYVPCIEPGSDVDCAGGSGNGPRYVEGPVQVVGPDDYGLDSDRDGIGCE